MKLTATVKYATPEQTPDGHINHSPVWYRIVGTAPFTDDDYLLADSIKGVDDALDFLQNMRRSLAAAAEGGV